ncbi:eEF1A lysine and N-terminal methyltransferase homolog [Macrosteles quadrilineatus]|uniref:eEF1A lysine and N-terminal methyltransferase homolog n=1 Tax=Macrosteles quadrilineatus TaxID=74068 RepID=UPI0023E0FF47|nr:eEF1A lysine and N-terminal methyltransferase homolog [Macrosteles quadrilineatus]
MNLLPKATSDFSQIGYWDSFFRKRGKRAFEWYGEYPELCGILHKYIRPKDKTLVIGCGNSTLSSDLYDVGYRQITNIDVSSVVIKQMKAKSKIKPGLEYQQMDATKMTFQDALFNVVLDKGTLDALMPDSNPETIDKINALFNEVDRVLTPLGRYVCVSLLQRHILQHLLDQFSGRGWMVRILRCLEAENKSDSGMTLPVFVVICTKLKKMPGSKPVFEVSQGGEIVQRMATLEETLESVKTQQDTALVCSGLNRCSVANAGEVTIELSRPGDKYPRYTVTVADSPKAKDPGSMKFAAFIVPQGREREWLFGSPEGRQILVQNSGFDRLAVIRLHREHKYESLKATQDETSDTVLRLAPNYKSSGPRPKIPFLSVAEDLGNVTEIARGTSDISGDFIIEDAEGGDKQLYRRLVFLVNQSVVQSESKLKIVQQNGETIKTVDLCYLGCDHHVYMTMGVTMVATEKPFHVLVIGLGGGGLCTYIHNCFLSVRVTAVDIDPKILEVATKYFHLKEDERLQTVIEDGLDYLKKAASSGVKYDAVLFDIDSKDSSLGLSCPPASFLESDILTATAGCLDDSGVFVLNLTCRIADIRQKTWTRLRKLYKDISTVKLEQEVNEIFFCWKTKATMSLPDAADKLNSIVKMRKIQEDDLVDKEELLTLIRSK